MQRTTWKLQSKKKMVTKVKRNKTDKSEEKAKQIRDPKRNILKIKTTSKKNQYGKQPEKGWDKKNPRIKLTIKTYNRKNNQKLKRQGSKIQRRNETKKKRQLGIRT